MALRRLPMVVPAGPSPRGHAKSGSWPKSRQRRAMPGRMTVTLTGTGFGDSMRPLPARTSNIGKGAIRIASRSKAIVVLRQKRVTLEFRHSAGAKTHHAASLTQQISVARPTPERYAGRDILVPNPLGSSPPARTWAQMLGRQPEVRRPKSGAQQLRRRRWSSASWAAFMGGQFGSARTPLVGSSMRHTRPPGSKRRSIRASGSPLSIRLVPKPRRVGGVTGGPPNSRQISDK